MIKKTASYLILSIFPLIQPFNVSFPNASKCPHLKIENNYGTTSIPGDKKNQKLLPLVSFSFYRDLEKK